MKENGKTDGIDEEECIADYYLPYFSDWLHNVFFLHVLGFVLQQSAQSNSAEILKKIWKAQKERELNMRRTLDSGNWGILDEKSLSQDDYVSVIFNKKINGYFSMSLYSADDSPLLRIRFFEYPFYAKQVVIHFLLNLFDDSCSSDFEIETMRYEEAITLFEDNEDGQN